MKYRQVQGLVYTAPALLLVLAIFVAPAIYTIRMSLFHTTHTETTYVGLANYTELGVLWEPFLVSGRFLLVMSFYSMVLAFIIALVLFRLNPRIAAAMRTIYYIPVVIGGTSTLVAWRWIYRTDGGFLNSLFGTQVMWLGEPTLAVWAVIFTMMGVYLGANVLLYSSALGQIPTEVIEAAQLDGANWLQIAWYMLVPLTQPTRIYIALMTFIGGMQIWEHPWLMTDGGPIGTTTTLTLKVFYTAFAKYRLGLASAMTAVCAVVVIGAALVLLKKR